MNQINEKKLTNKKGMFYFGIVAVVLTIAYVIEIVKGSTTVPVFAGVTALLCIPIIVSIVIYQKDNESPIIKYVLGISYALAWSFVMFNTTNINTMLYIVPIFPVLLTWQDMPFVKRTSATYLACVIMQTARFIILGIINMDLLATFEIIIAAILLTYVFCLQSSKVTGTLSNAKLDEIKEKEEKLRNMFAIVNDVVAQLQELVSEIDVKAQAIKENSAQSNEATKEISVATGELNNSIQHQLDISENIQGSVSSTNTTAVAVQGELSELSNRIKSGLTDIETLKSTSEKGKEISGNVSNVMNELLKGSDEAKGILSLILNVASQTKLLALNASIEAARAGEAGKGFAVVAGEIGKLSEESSSSAKKISDILEILNSDIHQTSEQVGVLLSNLEAQGELVDKASAVFADMESGISDVDNAMNMQTQSFASVISDTGDINSEIEGLSAFAQELLANVESVTELTEQNTREVSDISGMLSDVVINVERLTEVLKAE